MTHTADEPDIEGLAAALTSIAYPARLEILDQVRFPRRLAEVRVTSRRESADANPDRPISKQAVHAHLDKLVESGLVRVHEGDAGDVRYVANAARLYALVEDLRRLCWRYSARAGEDATGTLGSQPPPERARGPRLVLVHGIYEGRAYPLSVPSGGPWLIGRSLNAAMRLDYDPYVSAEHAEIFRDADGYALRDLRTGKNGTFLNWEPVPRGGEVRLAPADVVGVGRSLLSFRLA